MVYFLSLFVRVYLRRSRLPNKRTTKRKEPVFQQRIENSVNFIAVTGRVSLEPTSAVFSLIR